MVISKVVTSSLVLASRVLGNCCMYDIILGLAISFSESRSSLPNTLLTLANHLMVLKCVYKEDLPVLLCGLRVTNISRLLT